MVAAVLALICALNPSGTPQSKPEKYITRFGAQYLEGVDVVAEVEVGKIRSLGMAVDVVTMNPQRILIPPPSAGKRKAEPLLVLSNRGKYVKGMRFMVFLELYGSGARYVTKQRLSFADKDYKEKVRLIEAYIAVEGIKKIEERVKALKAMLLENIGDASDWVRWNTLDELEKLVKERAAVFTRVDVERIDAVIRMDFPPSFGRSLAKVRSAIAETLDGKKDKQ
jgi:hypothetical protein